MVAVLPALSVIWILPRATPMPALRSASSVSLTTKPLPSSKLSLVSPTGVKPVSVNPLVIFWLVETSCLTRNEKVPGWALPPMTGLAFSTLVSLLAARIDWKTLSVRRPAEVVLRLSSRALMSRNADCWF